MASIQQKIKCHKCSAELELADQFCYSCGWEVAPPCPICKARRFILDPNIPSWCATETCRQVTPFCRACRRCLEPGTDRCPVCANPPVSLYSQHAGRVPGETLQDRPNFTEPGDGAMDRLTMVETFPRLTQEVKAVFAAHDRLYAWEDASDGNPILHVAKATGLETPFNLASDFHAPLPMPVQERSAMLGRFAILALEDRFTSIDLVTGEISDGMPKGKPITQAGWLDQWVGWIRDESAEVGQQMQLWQARQPSGRRWSPEATQLLAADTTSQISPWGPLLLHQRRVYWATKEGAVISVDLRNESSASQPVELLEAREGCRRVWLCGVDTGVVIVREEGNLAYARRMPSSGTEVELVELHGPLRSVYATGNRLIVVGQSVFVYDTTTWQEVTRVVRPQGKWIDGFLAHDVRNSLLIYGLVKEHDDADNPWSSVFRISFDRIAPTLLWRDQVDAERIVAAVPELLVAHREGVLRREQNPLKAL